LTATCAADRIVPATILSDTNFAGEKEESDMERTLGPRKLGGIINETFTIYGRNFWRFVAISNVVTLPITIIAIIVIIAINVSVYA
jgi:hypothetical protein